MMMIYHHNRFMGYIDHSVIHGFISVWLNYLVALRYSARAKSNMSAIKALNPKAEVARAAQALAINISAAKGLQDVLRTNLGPKGTMKM